MSSLAGTKNETENVIKILCLHGYRTNGEILRCQTAALRKHLQMDMRYVTAPMEATDPPDEGTRTFYPNQLYNAWYCDKSLPFEHAGMHREDEETIETQTCKSLSFILDEMKNEVSRTGRGYDGLLGFSQGASLITALLCRLSNMRLDGTIVDVVPAAAVALKFVVLIAGVNPPPAVMDAIATGSIHFCEEKLREESFDFCAIDERKCEENSHPISTVAAVAGEKDEIEITAASPRFPNNVLLQQTASLHIMGDSDALKPRSEKLLRLYQEANTCLSTGALCTTTMTGMDVAFSGSGRRQLDVTDCVAGGLEKVLAADVSSDRLDDAFPSRLKVLRHKEGHNIPSRRTSLYPEIKAWIEATVAAASVPTTALAVTKNE